MDDIYQYYEKDMLYPHFAHSWYKSNMSCEESPHPAISSEERTPTLTSYLANSSSQRGV